jgi:hypothetical protein
MSAENFRRPRDIETYVTAHVRAYNLASKALALRAGGDLATANAAAEKVQLWLRMIAILETHGKRIN